MRPLEQYLFACAALMLLIYPFEKYAVFNQIVLFGLAFWFGFRACLQMVRDTSDKPPKERPEP